MGVSPATPTYTSAASLRVAREVARPADDRSDEGASATARWSETDEATFSPEALALAREDTAKRSPEEPEKSAGGETELTEDERRQVEKLRARDAEVRSHEAAHIAAGGSHVRGGATYTYQQGPDGKQYAIGGEVGIDVSPVPNNPQATIQKMQQVRAAALAPAEPSGADRAVAAKAAQAEAQARKELAELAAARASEAYGATSDENTGARLEAVA